jgi:cytochrome c oxidase subunit III
VSVSLPAINSEFPVAEQRSGSNLTPGQWGVIAFLSSEVAFFSTLIVTYLAFYRKDSEPGGLGGPQPGDVLSLNLVIVTTICLLASSVTVHLADQALRKGGHTAFRLFWTLTIGLGTAFLLGTGKEWYDLIVQHHLTINRNLFGTTFYTLVGFHAFHVTVGVLVMLIVLGLALAERLPDKNRTSVQLVSWYWHFVDAVWIVVFSVVYLMPRLEQ